MNKVKYIWLFFIINSAFLANAQLVDLNKLEPSVLINRGDYNNALLKIESLLLENQNIDLLLAKVQTLYNLERYPEALMLCDEIGKIDHKSAAYWRILIYNRNSDEEGVRTVLSESKTRGNVIDLYDLLTKEEFADLQYRVLDETEYTLFEKQIYQTKILIDKQKYLQALFIVEELISQNPKNAEVYYLQSVIYSYLDDNRKANFAIEKAISLKTSEASFYYQKVKVCLLNQNFEEALENSKKLIRKEPYQISNYVLHLKVLSANKLYDKVQELSEELLVLLPGNYDVLLLNGKSNLEGGDYLQALKSTNTALQLKTTKEAFNLRADIYMATKTYQFAEYDYSMSLDIDPYDGDVYSKKGLARFSQGNLKGACSDWEKAIRYGSYQAVKYKEQYCK